MYPSRLAERQTRDFPEEHIHNHYSQAPNEAYAYPDDREMENVGKDHNRRQEFTGRDNKFSNLSEKYTIYPYTDYDEASNRNPEVPTHATYHVGRTPSQSSRFPKYLIVVVVVVFLAMAGLLYWFFKDRYRPVLNDRHVMGQQTAAFMVGGNQPRTLIRSGGQMFQCPGFIHKDRCLRCPQNAIWDGNNCIMTQKQPVHKSRFQQ